MGIKSVVIDEDLKRIHVSLDDDTLVRIRIGLEETLKKMETDIKEKERHPDHEGLFEVNTYCKENNIDFDEAMAWFVNMYQHAYMVLLNQGLSVSMGLEDLKNKYNIEEADIELINSYFGDERTDSRLVHYIIHMKKVITGEKKLAYMKWLSPELVKRKYDEIGSIKKVAELFNVCPTTIKNRLKEWRTAHKE